MDSNSLELAEKARKAYATDYTGTDQRAFKNFLNRHKGPGDFDEKLPEFVRMKGPYLQALSIPRQSEEPWEEFAQGVEAEFASNGLDPQLIRAVSEAGIEHLYSFQQRAMEYVLDDKSALITASTGRGKTESWLIPILQFILEAKEGLHPNHPKTSVKCVLNYPTKALAQDQLKRLIDYLYKINKNRPQDKQITVGIRDGDTPSDDQDAYSYLHAAFKYFKCPCEHCSSSLAVTENEDGRKVLEPSADLDEDVSLDWIYLTREDILEEKVDILLTNPDTINFRLFNINAKEEHEAFVKEPKYMVFDEVHEYQGLFGSFTSVLMRRYLQMRKRLLEYEERDQDDLRIIAASATVKNKEELFQKINPLTDRELEPIAEDPREIDAELPSDFPDEFLKYKFSAEDIKETIEDNDSPITEQLLELVDLNQEDLSQRSKSDIQEALGNHLFVKLTSEDTPSELAFVRGLYSKLAEKPQHYGELKETVQARYDLSTSETDNLIQNFIAIGQLSGILENRAHLFSWPIDGYYTCINCGLIFDSPRESCPDCDHHFVTKVAFCNVCGEEALESWFCPECQIPIPLTTTSEGQYEYNQNYECNCSTETVRTIWRPIYQCTSCGNKQEINRIQYCDDCDSVLVLSDGGQEYNCSNPSCGFTKEGGVEVSCSDCHSELEVMKGQSVAYCDSCEERTEDLTAQRCECGGELNYFRYLGWSCSDLDCDEVYFNEPPSTCSCNNRRFVLRGLMDITRVSRCSNCDMEVMRTKTCSCDEPDMTPNVRTFTSYKMVDDEWKIRNGGDFRGALPCYHKGRGYRKNGSQQRYNALLRSPQNIAVTTSQYLLRDIVNPDNPETYEHSKVLSFSDSHSDMKELSRDFNEPEEELLIDQLVVEGLLNSGENWITLAELQKEVIDQIEELQDGLSTTQMTNTQVNLLKKLNKSYNEDDATYVKNEIAARVLNGFFNRAFFRRPSHYPLTNIGILNTRLDYNPENLTDEERTIIRELVSADNSGISHLREETEIPDLLNHIEDLVEKDLVIHHDRRIELNKEKVLCGLVSEEVPIQYQPPREEDDYTYNREDFKSDFWLQFNDIDSNNYTTFTKSFDERTKFSDEHFSRLAYKIAYSPPMMLWSEPYYGHTDKKTRRELEYRFSEARHPHFLSSGPAMEVGIDIGDLDSLLLFGAPPNTNSYIQRIGRAGRRSGTSLVHSVSKRNPIDYYYFEKPEELIQSKPQPVPLNEVNQEVMKISLTWALLDYIAANYWIPWRKEDTPQGTKITDGEEFESRPNIRPNDIIPFTNLASHTNSELAMETDSPKLDVLRVIVNDDADDGVRDWLEGIVDFNYCPTCGAKYESGFGGDCAVDECGSSLISAKEEFSDTIDDVIAEFGDNMIKEYRKLDDEIWEQRQDIIDKIRDIDGELRNITDDDERAKLRSDKRSLQERRDQLVRYNNRLQNQEYFDFLKSKSRYAFGLRSVSDSVDYELLGNDFEPERDDMQSRNVRQALSELHPGAAYLYQDQNYIVTRVWWNDYETSQISDILPPAAVCPTCGEEYEELDKLECDYCDMNLRRRTTKVPSRAVAYREDLKIGEWPDGSNFQAGNIYRNSDAEVQGTFAERETEVIDFEEKSRFEIVNEDGVKQGEIDYGNALIVSVAESYRANYKGGGADPLPNLFEVCGVRNCNGVIKRTENTAFCSHDVNHDVEESEVVKLAHQFETKGIRVRFDDEELEHSFTHGIRLALQYIGGVGVRQIPESVEEDGSYIFEVEEGGSGITVLLTLLEDGIYENFERALQIMEENFECDCRNGCPLCLYQYGCDERNNPETLDRENLQELLRSGLSLVKSEEEQDE